MLISDIYRLIACDGLSVLMVLLYRLDFTGKTHNLGIGLPPAPKNREKWEMMRPILEDPAMKPTEAQIKLTVAKFVELLRIRRSTALIGLREAKQVRVMSLRMR